MGIEGYTRWLHEQYSDCFTAAPPSKPRSFDHIYLDLNGHFHYWAYQGAKNEEHLTKLVYVLLRSMILWTLLRKLAVI
jgi:5'-3' exonuclease